jgi:hypothetical protein
MLTHTLQAPSCCAAMAMLHLDKLAVQLRAQVEAAARSFEQSQRREDADAVVEAIKGVQASPNAADLLADFVRPVQQKLDVWRTQTASEAKLNKALASGASTQQLARAIQEASAAGVKVNKAKRTLKVGHYLPLLATVHRRCAVVEVLCFCLFVTSSTSMLSCSCASGSFMIALASSCRRAIL